MVNVMANIQHRERSMNALPTTGELFATNRWNKPCLPTHWERVYSRTMADFTPEEVLQVIVAGRRCVSANLQDIDLYGADLR